MIRGDHDLFSVMDEMASGGTKHDHKTMLKKNISSSSNQRAQKDPTKQRIRCESVRTRMMPELEGYGESDSERRQHQRNRSSRKRSDTSAIWNPYIHVPLSFTTHSNQNNQISTCAPQSLTPPTAPYVEVARRRAYEKFKKNFYNAFNWVAHNSQQHPHHHQNKKNDDDNDDDNDKKKKKRKKKEFDFNTIWNKNSHSILERYYFASKVEESFQIISNRNALAISNTSESLLHIPKHATIGQITNLFGSMRTDMHPSTSSPKTRNQPTIMIMDPILLAPFQRNRNGNHLLRNEVQFQLRREYKKATNSKGSNNMQEEEDEGAIDEFFQSRAFQKKMSKTARSINDIQMEAEVEFLSDLQKKVNQVALSSKSKGSKSKSKSIPKISFDSQTDQESGEAIECYWLKYLGLSFKISKLHFQKLQILYDRHNPNSIDLREHMNAFYCALFTLLTRYDLLEGGGLQSAIGGHVFDVLLEYFDCKVECFASPFNCRYGKFCHPSRRMTHDNRCMYEIVSSPFISLYFKERYFSAFQDTDEAFGSLGSFFNFDFEKLTDGGCFQANPPFASDFILQMCQRMETILLSNDNEESSPPLMFVVFVPAWQESTGWQALSKAKSLVHHLFLSQKENLHFYCEGTQHRRLKGRYRVASFDTSVFFLQNRTGRNKWSVTEEMLDQLRNAFGSNPEELSSSSSTLATTEVDSSITTLKPLKNGERMKKQIDSKREEEEDATEDNDKDHIKNTGRKRKHDQKPAEKKGKAKKKKKFVADDGQSQLAILSSLGISAPECSSNESTKITKSKSKGKGNGKKRRSK